LPMKPAEVCPESIGLRLGRVRVNGMTAMLNITRSIQSQTFRIFYKGQIQSSGRSSFLSRDTTELVPISSDVIKSSGAMPGAGEVSECRV
jgi:hypothetical protein